MSADENRYAKWLETVSDKQLRMASGFLARMGVGIKTRIVQLRQDFEGVARRHALVRAEWRRREKASRRRA